MNIYATLDEARNYLEMNVADHTILQQDSRLIGFLVRASRMFDMYATDGARFKRHFFPQVATFDYDHPVGGRDSGDGHDTRTLLTDLAWKNARVLDLNRDLLSVTTLTTNNGSQVIASADYVLNSVAGDYLRPYDRIELTGEGGVTEFTYTDTPLKANQVVGMWGYHDDYDNAWYNADTVQDDPLSDSATELTVSAAGALDEYGISPMFQRGQLLRIEDEMLWVTGIEGNVLTVRRGMNGTTAAAHVQTTAVEIFRPMPEIKEALLQLMTHIFRRKDSVGRDVDQQMVNDRGFVVMPGRLPAQVMEILDRYRKVRF